MLAVSPEAGEGLKCIERVLDQEPVLDEAGLRLAAFVRERYFCTFYDAIKAMLPAGLWFRKVDRIAAVPGADWRPAVARRPLAAQIMTCLEALGGEAEYSRLRQLAEDEAALQGALRYL